jgi:acyl-CoA synthetase (AMP-forming)/AMP-acid ligase II
LGAKPLETVDGDFASVGDLGYVDADGYLFLADRRVDQIITGGANVVPAEVEAVLTQHPGVRDAAVIGLKDDDLGRRVHCSDRTGQRGRAAGARGAGRPSAPAPGELQAAAQLRDRGDTAA